MRLSAPLYRLTEFLVARLGEFPAFLLVSFALPRLLRAAATRFFIAADARGWLEKYRIQPGRRVAAADVQNLWAAKYGAGSWRGLLLYALPLETLNFVMQKRRGLSLSGGTETWAELARSLAVAAFVWDTFVWAAHVALHHPLLYKRFHKQHHEFQAPMILVSEHFHPLDNLLEATLGAYIGNCVGRTSWFAMNIFGWWRLWTVIHNHCGFRVPWDIFNWMFGYIEVR